MASATAGGKGSVTSPIPGRMIFGRGLFFENMLLYASHMA
jgi:hypothetical protein